ncbi:MAG: hypothetical protein JXR63_09460 [Spirochaetales bacterium]|nr:hypothetical protein [Spirochaetales bacterium]
MVNVLRGELMKKIFLLIIITICLMGCPEWTAPDNILDKIDGDVIIGFESFPSQWTNLTKPVTLKPNFASLSFSEDPDANLKEIEAFKSAVKEIRWRVYNVYTLESKIQTSEGKDYFVGNEISIPQLDPEHYRIEMIFVLEEGAKPNGWNSRTFIKEFIVMASGQIENMIVLGLGLDAENNSQDTGYRDDDGVTKINNDLIINCQVISEITEESKFEVVIKKKDLIESTSTVIRTLPVDNELIDSEGRFSVLFEKDANAEQIDDGYYEILLTDGSKASKKWTLKIDTVAPVIEWTNTFPNDSETGQPADTLSLDWDSDVTLVNTYCFIKGNETLALETRRILQHNFPQSFYDEVKNASFELFSSRLGGEQYAQVDVQDEAGNISNAIARSITVNFPACPTVVNGDFENGSGFPADNWGSWGAKYAYSAGEGVLSDWYGLVGTEDLNYSENIDHYPGFLNTSILGYDGKVCLGPALYGDKEKAPSDISAANNMLLVFGGASDLSHWWHTVGHVISPVNFKLKENCYRLNRGVIYKLSVDAKYNENYGSSASDSQPIKAGFIIQEFGSDHSASSIPGYDNYANYPRLAGAFLDKTKHSDRSWNTLSFEYYAVNEIYIVLKLFQNGAGSEDWGSHHETCFDNVKIEIVGPTVLDEIQTVSF